MYTHYTLGESHTLIGKESRCLTRDTTLLVHENVVQHPSLAILGANLPNHKHTVIQVSAFHKK